MIFLPDIVRVKKGDPICAVRDRGKGSIARRSRALVHLSQHSDAGTTSGFERLEFKINGARRTVIHDNDI